MTTVWITKYALTLGIFKVEAESCKNGMATWRSGSHNFLQFAFAKDWHLNPAAALERAEEMRIKKLQALDRQSKKISAIKFTAE